MCLFTASPNHIASANFANLPIVLSTATPSSSIKLIWRLSLRTSRTTDFRSAASISFVGEFWTLQIGLPGVCSGAILTAEAIICLWEGFRNLLRSLEQRVVCSRSVKVCNEENCVNKGFYNLSDIDSYIDLAEDRKELCWRPSFCLSSKFAWVESHHKYFYDICACRGDAVYQHFDCIHPDVCGWKQ